jgi:hypothetical protein
LTHKQRRHIIDVAGVPLVDIRALCCYRAPSLGRAVVDLLAQLFVREGRTHATLRRDEVGARENQHDCNQESAAMWSVAAPGRRCHRAPARAVQRTDMPGPRRAFRKQAECLATPLSTKLTNQPLHAKTGANPRPSRPNSLYEKDASGSASQRTHQARRRR